MLKSMRAFFSSNGAPGGIMTTEEKILRRVKSGELAIDAQGRIWWLRGVSAIAKGFGASREKIANIKRGRTWKHVA